jgi:hypothetical protein
MRTVVLKVGDRVRAREELLDECVVGGYERPREGQVDATSEIEVRVVEPGV